MTKYGKTLKKIAQILISLGAIGFSATAFANVVAQSEGGLFLFDRDNETFWFSIGGRLEYDQIFFSGTYRDRGRGHFPNSGNVRRAFLALEGGVGSGWIYNLTLDFGRTSHVRARRDRGVTDRFLGHRKIVTNGFTFLEEAWIGYTGLWDCSRIRFGQFTPIATMDGYANYGISNGQMFLESALATRAFAVPSYINSSSPSMKGFGIIWETELADLFTVAATVYEPAQGFDNVYNNPFRSDRVGTAMRVTFSPVHEEGCVIHAGLLGRYQRLNSFNGERRNNRLVQINGRTVRADAAYNELFFTSPEVVPRNYVGVFESFNPAITRIPFHNNHGSPILVDAGAFRAKSYNQFAGELLGIWGPITLQGEYHYANVQRRPREFFNLPGRRGQKIRDRGNVGFHGFHVQGGYVLTGESRDYDFLAGVLGGISPASSCGAWEVVARYSQVDLNNKNVRGGSERNVTAGLNWYVNEHIRFAFNYIRANIHATNYRRAGAPRFARNRVFPTAPQTTDGLGRHHRRFHHHRKVNLDIFALRAQVVF